MKKHAIALALALTMLGTLAACGTDKNPNNANNGSTNGTNSGTTGGTASGSNNGTASGSGTGSAGQVTRRYNTTMNQDSGYLYGNSYLEDGRYAAGSNGQVYGSKNNDLSRDLTRGARDIVRGTENAMDDLGHGIGDMTRDLTGNNTYSGTPSWEPDSSARY